ncbi:Zinc metalloproteinase nas-36 [Mizuhopecten yessoensis]|uniref:Zinc metalloproteinase nas-36 n=1 Tax=Mizuhopecten yessoensis TaxID=6573 RepID=A0A210QMX5_MIZYE|nr:Zinc metalloproteinase nas-36 [Mizuhopecten yessoensis]
MQTSDPSYNSLLYTLSRKFTHYDSQTIVRAYACDEDCTNNCENGGFIRKTVNNDQCHCRCPEYLTGPTCADRTSTCGDIIELQEGETKLVDTGGFPNSYPVGEACTYLIKAPANNRIRITLKGLDVPCGHDLEFRTHLMGEFGLMECGSLSSEKEFVTFPNGEANIAMVILHADDTSITPGTGASLELTAFASGCIDNPCRNGGTCDEDSSTPAFCICPPGYSGDTCNFVTATATVGCDVQFDVEGVCCFTDVSAGTVEYFQIRNTDAVQYPYLLASSVGIYTIADEALLESNVEFEDAVRCLSFDEAAIHDQNSNVRVKTTYTEKDGTVKLVSETEDTDGFFVSRQATLSRHVEKFAKSLVSMSGEVLQLDDMFVELFNTAFNIINLEIETEVHIGEALRYVFMFIRVDQNLVFSFFTGVDLHSHDSTHKDITHVYS